MKHYAYIRRSLHRPHVFRFLLFIALVTLLSFGVQSSVAQQEAARLLNPQEAALNRLKASSETPPQVYFTNGFPNSVLGSFAATGADAAERSRNFLATYSDLYRLNNPDLGLVLRAVEPNENIETALFDQDYKGVRVYGAQLAVTLIRDHLRSTLGSLLMEDIDLDVAPALSDLEAERLALDDLALGDLPIIAETRLMIYDPRLREGTTDLPRLVWRVLTAGQAPWIVFVDAHTGDIVGKNSLREESFDLDLEDANGTNSEDTSCYWWTDEDDEIGDEDGVYEEAQDDEDAVAAWQAASDAYSFYYTNFNRDSYDGDDGEIEVYVHADVAEVTASWHGGTTDCDLINLSNGAVSLDIMVHEFTHGVNQFRLFGAFVKSGQSGALNEGYADIMASFADNDWILGTDTTGGIPPLRDLSDPPSMGDPDRMSNFVNTSADNGGVHTNSTIVSKTAFLLAEGDTFNGITIDSITFSKTMELYYWTLLHLPSNAQFLDARNLTVMNADIFAQYGMFGFTDDDACQVRNAFAAVELGYADLNCDGVEEDLDPDDDDVLTPDDNCPLVFNPLQDDDDNDGQGNYCDIDFWTDPDGDGFPTGTDNCSDIANPDQTDQNFNGIGAACDPTEDDDFDDDLILNVGDNCPFDENFLQTDMDDDGVGDACDVPDDDGDGISGDDDNCSLTENPDQIDSDGDGLGDACDVCPNDVDDGISTTYFKNPITGEFTYNYSVPDDDNDGIPDACDDNISISGEMPDDIRATLNLDLCIPLEIHIKPQPRSYIKLLLPSGGETSELYDADQRLVFMLEDVPDTAKIWVLNSDGMPADEASGEGSSQMLRFRPVGGQQYWLAFNFSPYTVADQSITIHGIMFTQHNDTSDCLTGRTAPTPTPTQIPATPTLLPIEPPQPTPAPQPYVNFTADATELTARSCTTLRWQTANISAVYFEGQGVVGEGAQEVCPSQTQTFNLLVVFQDGSQQTFPLTINITQPPPSDRDGDGLPDDQDRCPDQAGIAELGGCPLPPDRDGDSVPDDQDRCPDQAGPPEAAGCSDDRDADGITNDQDRCPDEAGSSLNNGCPLGRS